MNSLHLDHAHAYADYRASTIRIERRRPADEPSPAARALHRLVARFRRAGTTVAELAADPVAAIEDGRVA